MFRTPYSRKNFEIQIKWQKKFHIPLHSNDARDGSKLMGYPGREHRKGGEDFFRKKLGGQDFFRKKIRRAKTFFKFLKSKISFSKKAIFEDQKVVYVGGM